MAIPRRFQLQFGPYKTPRFRCGWLIADEVRGEVEIVGVSEGRMVRIRQAAEDAD